MTVSDTDERQPEDDSPDSYGGQAFAGQSNAIADNPQPLYAMFNQAPSPIATPAGPMACTRADVETVLHDPSLFTARQPPRMGNTRPLLPLEVDPPEQRGYRKILDPLFAPPQVAKLEDSIRALTNELIDGFIDKPEIDFAQEFSMLLPTQIFLRILGIPSEELPHLLKLKDGATRLHHLMKKPFADPEVVARRNENGQAIYAYFNAQLDARLDNPADDLLSGFLTVEVEGQRLTRDEMLDICFLMLTAGLDTVTGALDCFMDFLAHNPAKRAELVADPELVRPAVEELMRWQSPVQTVTRIATQDTEVRGCPIKAGEMVIAVLGAANVDTADVADANEVRWDREVNRHIAFGTGVHRCIGSHLARLELRAIMQEWHARIPNYRLKPGAELHYSTGVRATESWPMLLGVSE